MEFVILILVISLQAYSFWRTNQKIQGLSSSFPAADQYETVRLTVSDDMLLSGQVEGILNDVAVGRVPETHFMVAQSSVLLARTRFPRETLFGRLVYTINKYVLRSRAVAPNFEMIENLVEREYRQLQTHIEETINVPLYVGLIGTLLGIVWGLLNVDLKGDLAGIQSLLSGVKWAMVASAIGLSLTTLNSSFFYQRAQNKALENKNRFFNFLQIDLLTAISGGDLASVVMNMQKNLDLFNNRFKDNLVEFDKSMNSVFENTKVQRDFLVRLEQVDFQKIVQGNIEIFSKMQGAVDQFDKFAVYMTKLNDNLAIANTLTDKMDKLATRADQAGLSVGAIAGEVNTRLNTANDLLVFLKGHFAELDARKEALAHAIIKFDDFLNKSFNELEKTTIERSTSIRDNAIKQEQQMIEALSANRGQFAQLENLKPMREQLELLFNQSVALRTSLQTVEAQVETATLALKNGGNNAAQTPFWTRVKGVFQKEK